ncbi:hypothetical protein SDC9_202916 [bioreactor metagenome]|uniref:Uncharacterized protein n=1 Tax=bioreactor metagenome TaxID=1076179 RepID=A0A645IVN3_9ZZZZ
MILRGLIVLQRHVIVLFHANPMMIKITNPEHAIGVVALRRLHEPLKRLVNIPLDPIPGIVAPAKFVFSGIVPLICQKTEPIRGGHCAVVHVDILLQALARIQLRVGVPRLSRL